MYDTRIPYDKSAAIWSPTGELVQLEYARKASQRGAAAVGVVTENNSVIFVGEKSRDTLQAAPEKTQKVAEELYMVASGLSTDSNLLLQQARVISQNHKLVYGENIGPKGLAMRLGDLMARHTIQGGLRPFGTSLLLAGFQPVTKNAELFFIDNGGTYLAVKAYATGQGGEKAIALLREKIKENPNVSEEEGKKLALMALTAAIGKTEPVKDEEVEIKVISVNSA